MLNSQQASSICELGLAAVPLKPNLTEIMGNHCHESLIPMPPITGSHWSMETEPKTLNILRELMFSAVFWVSHPVFAGEPVWTRQDGNAWRRPWNTQIGWRMQPLSLRLRLIWFDVSPLGSAWACSLSFCW